MFKGSTYFVIVFLTMSACDTECLVNLELTEALQRIFEKIK